MLLTNAAKSPSHSSTVVQQLTPVLCLQFFVIGHDCGHRSFSKNKLVEDIVGTLAFMPLLYPFEPWRIKHNVHHTHTNKCAASLACSDDFEQEAFCWHCIVQLLWQEALALHHAAVTVHLQ